MPSLVWPSDDANGINLVHPAVVSFQGIIVVFCQDSATPGCPSKLYYNLRLLQPQQSAPSSLEWNEAGSYSGWYELDVDAGADPAKTSSEVRVAGMNLITVPATVPGGPETVVGSPASEPSKFRVISDDRYIYVFRVSGQNTLWLNRFMLEAIRENPVDADQGDPTTFRYQLQPAWDVRYRRSGLRDTPAGPSDTLDYRDITGTPFIEPTQEISICSHVSPTAWDITLLPSATTGPKRWTVFYWDISTPNTIRVVSFPQAQNGLMDLSPETISRSSFVPKREGITAAPSLKQIVLCQYGEREAAALPGQSEGSLKRGARVMVSIIADWPTPETSANTIYDFSVLTDGSLPPVPSQAVCHSIDSIDSIITSPLQVTDAMVFASQTGTVYCYSSSYLTPGPTPDGNYDNANLPTMLDASDGYLHYYFYSPGRVNGLFPGLFAAQYDPTVTRAIVSVPLSSGAGTLSLIATRAGSSMGDLSVTITNNAATGGGTDLCDLTINYGTKSNIGTEQWSGVPREINAFLAVLNGLARGEPSLPSVASGQTTYFDYSGKIYQVRVPLASNNANGIGFLTLISTRLGNTTYPGLPLHSATLKEDGNGALALILQFSVSDGVFLTQTWPDLPNDLTASAAVTILKGSASSATYAYTTVSSDVPVLALDSSGGSILFFLKRESANQVATIQVTNRSAGMVTVTATKARDSTPLFSQDVASGQFDFCQALHNNPQVNQYFSAIVAAPVDGVVTAQTTNGYANLRTLSTLFQTLPPVVDGVLAVSDVSYLAGNFQSHTQEGGTPLPLPDNMVALVADWENPPNDGSTVMVPIPRRGSRLSASAPPDNGKWILPLPQNSLELSGTQAMSVPGNSPAFSILAPNQALTLEAWVKPSYAASGTDNVIVNFADDSGNALGQIPSAYVMGLTERADGKFDLFGSVGGGARMTAETGLSANTWSHVAMRHIAGTGLSLNPNRTRTDFADCGNSSDFEFEDAMSIDAWIQIPRALETSQTIISKWGNKKGDQSFYLGVDTSGKLAASVQIKAALVTATSTVSVSDGRPHHVAMVFASTPKLDKSDDTGVTMSTSYTLELYIDGVLNQSEGDTAPDQQWIQAGNAKVYIGATANTTAPRFLSGELAGIRVWGRNLSAVEVAQAMAQGRGFPSNGAVAAWWFAEQAGKIAAESISNNNAKLSGSELWGLFRALDRLDFFAMGVQFAATPAPFTGTNFHDTYGINGGDSSHGPANAFDGDTATFYDCNAATGGFTGLDLGAGKAGRVSSISFFGRRNYASKMDGGVFEGTNDDPQSGTYTTLYTIATGEASGGAMVTKKSTVDTAFRYLRYRGPSNGHCNVAEIVFNGVLVVTQTFPQFMVGGILGDENAVIDGFHGLLDEIRVWNVPRLLGQLRDNMYSSLEGNENGLTGYWDFQGIDDPTRFVDKSMYARQGAAMPSATGTSLFSTDVPLGSHEGPWVTNPFREVPNSYHFPSFSVAVFEYGAAAKGPDGRLSALLKRQYIGSSIGTGVAISPSYNVGTLQLTYLGQVQTQPTLLGYIEGAPPVPSENLSRPYYNSTAAPFFNYFGASSVTFRDTESASFTFSSTDTHGEIPFDITSLLGLNMKYEWDLYTALGIFDIANAEAQVLAKGKATMEMTKTAGASFVGSWSDTITDTLALRGQWEPDNPAAFNATIGRRFLPANFGYALVSTMTADVYLMRNSATGAMIGKVTIPDTDIPPDKNIITFQINTSYIKNGTLDGKIGLENDPSYPNADAVRGSYFKPREAYRIKGEIEQQRAALNAYYAQFNAAKRGYYGSSDLNRKDLDKALFVDRAGDAVARLSIANTYVWTAEGGLHAEEQQFADRREYSFSGAQKYSVASGLSLSRKLGPFGLYAATDYLAGGSANVELKKQKTEESGFGLSVLVPGDPILLGWDQAQGRFSAQPCPGKVEAYRFNAFFLAPSTDNAQTFLDTVVDQNWLQSADPNAVALRSAQIAGQNPWRVLYRVTYVRRVPPAFDNTPNQTVAPKVTRVINVQDNAQLVQLILAQPTLLDNPNPTPYQIGQAVTAAMNPSTTDSPLNELLSWWDGFRAVSGNASLLYEILQNTQSYLIAGFETGALSSLHPRTRTTRSVPPPPNTTTEPDTTQPDTTTDTTAQPIVAFNTGMDPSATRDANYLYNGEQAYVVGQRGPWVKPPRGANWISFAAKYYGEKNALYSYDTKVMINASDPSTLTIEGQCAADDKCTIYVNTKKIQSPWTEGAAKESTLRPFKIPGTCFKTGENTITFEVNNSGGEETGLLVVFDASYSSST